MWITRIEGENPEPRSGSVFHSLVFDDDGMQVHKTILIWGGLYGIKNDIYEFDKTWKQIDCKVDPKICPVAGASSCSHKEFIYIYGGVVEAEHGHRFTEQVVRYDAKHRRLELIHCNDNPNGRIGAALIFYNNCLWLFGGSTIEGRAHNQLYRLDLSSKSWDLLETNGMRIVPRESHAGVFYQNPQGIPYLVVFGGIVLIFGEIDRRRDTLFLNLGRC